MQLKTASCGFFGLTSRLGSSVGGRSRDGSSSGHGDGSCCSRMHVYHRNRSAVVTFQQHDDCHGHTPSYYPKDQCSGPRHCRYVRPGHLHPRPALSSPPPSAWNGPPDHQLKKIFRCAGRQVKLLLWRRLCFRREGAPQKGREFVQKAPLAELVPQCSIAPSSSRAGQSCSSSA